MQRIVHVDGVPPAVEGEEEHEPGLGTHADADEDVLESRAGPLGDERPAFLAGLMGNLAVDGKLFDLVEGERAGALDDRQSAKPPARSC
jgi:hypothetical protein